MMMLSFLFVAVSLFLNQSQTDFVSERLEVAVKKYTEQGNALSLIEGDEQQGVLGNVLTYRVSGKSRHETILFHYTADNQIYDVTYGYGLSGNSTINSGEYYGLIYLNRLIFLAELNDERLFRAAVQIPGVELYSDRIAGNDQTISLLRTMLANDNLSIQHYSAERGYEMVFELRDTRNMIEIFIKPSLALITNGETWLYREQLTNYLRTNKFTSDIKFSHFFSFELEASSLKIKLPEAGIYRSQWDYKKNASNEHWNLISTLPDWGSNEPDWIQNHAGFWSTLNFPDSLRHQGLSKSVDYTIELSIMAERTIVLENVGYEGLSQIVAFGGFRLPSYYLVSEVIRNDKFYEIHGFWMIYHPELHFQHIIRVVDFVSTEANIPIWTRSKLHGMLGMRMEQIASLDAQSTREEFSGEKIQIRIK